MSNTQPKKPQMPMTEEQRPAQMASPPNAQAVARPSHEQISRRAYEIWEAHGRPEGRDDEHWRQAERELMLGKQ